MSQLFVRSLFLVALCLLSACERSTAISTVLTDSSGLRPGDPVVLDARKVGTIRAIEQVEQTQGYAISIGLRGEHADLVQTNAVAYVALEGPPSLVLMNPDAAAPPVSPGDRLKGLSPLEAAIWRAGDAAAAVTGIVDQFSRKILNYFRSDDWAQTQAEIDTEISRLAADSKQAAEGAMNDLEAMLDALNERAETGAQQLADELAELREEILRLEKEGNERLAAALRRLLEQLEAMVPSERPQPEPDQPVPI